MVAAADDLTRVRVLLVEDSENDALLLLRELRRGNYAAEARRVWTADDLAEALRDDWDVVFCDYVMPGFSGPEAVRMIRRRAQDLPIIMVSGEVGEDSAVTAMRAGANDFVLKGRLSRLLPALERELHERAARQRAALALHTAEGRLRLLVEQLPVGVVVTDADGQVADLNRAALDILGSPSVEASRQLNVLTMPNMTDTPIRAAYAHVLAGGGIQRLVGSYTSAWGKVSELQFDVVPLRDTIGQPCGTIGIVQDLTERLRAEAALGYSQQRLEELVNSIEGVVWEADPRTFAFTYVSPQVERMFGYPLARWIGDRDFWPSLIHADDREAAVERCSEATRRLEDHTFEYRMHAADGRVVWVRDIVTVVVEAGEPLRLRGIMIDVTDQHRADAALRASEERFRALAEHSSEGLALVDAGGTIIYASQAHARILGRGPEGIVGRPALVNAHPDDTAVFAAVFERPRVPIAGRLRMRHADGDWRWIEATAVNLLDDPHVGAIVFNYRDVTAQRRAQEEIERLNRELERRVQERTAELEAANRELHAFSSSVSHDLRAPLRAVDGFAGILLEDHAEELSPPARHHLERISTASRRMSELIDQLLALSRVAQVELRRVPVDLSALARLIAADLQQGEPARRANFAIAEGLVAEADPTLMRIVLENLIGNAWKYTGRKAEARISFGRRDRDGQTIFLVRDDGAGFDMAAADRLFRPFLRLHDPAEFDGTGIGLATVERIVHRHGGRIWAEAAVERGATFYFTLGLRD